MADENLRHGEDNLELVKLSEKDQEKGVFKLNKTMLASKVAYCVYFFGSGAHLPFTSVFLRSVGFHPTRIGIITGLCQIARTISCPIWSALADKTRKHFLIVQFLSIAEILVNFPLPWIARSLSSNVNYTCFNNEVSNATQNTTVSDVPFEHASTPYFFSMVAVMVFAGLFEGAVPNFVDTRTMNLINQESPQSTFGQQRYFGAIGFGISSVVTGYMVKSIKTIGLSCYTPAFYLYLAGMVLFIGNNVFLFKGKLAEKRETKVSIWKPLCGILKKPRVLFFYATALMVGMAEGFQFGFVFLLMEEIEADKIVMGLTVLVSCTVEVMVFPVSAKIIRLLGGPEIVMGLGVLSWSARFLMISYFQNQWLIMSTSILHAFGFALFWAAAIESAYKLSPKQISTTMLGILNAVYCGLGTLIASILGGMLYDKYGGRMLFRGVSFAYLIWGLLVFLDGMFLKKRNSKNARTNDGLLQGKEDA